MTDTNGIVQGEETMTPPAPLIGGETQSDTICGDSEQKKRKGRNILVNALPKTKYSDDDSSQASNKCDSTYKRIARKGNKPRLWRQRIEKMTCLRILWVLGCGMLRRERRKTESKKDEPRLE
jgi:hypothetical protein